MNCKNLLERLFQIKKQSPSRTLEQEADRGSHAENILRDELFKEVVDEIRKKLIDQWTDSPIRDTEGREEIHRMLYLLNSIVKNIEDTYETGQLARKQLVIEEEKRKREKHRRV
jgi:hypothetical protein